MIRYINSATAQNDVVIFSKTYCPFCMATKSLFKDMGSELGLASPPLVVELDKMKGGEERIEKGGGSCKGSSKRILDDLQDPTIFF